MSPEHCRACQRIATKAAYQIVEDGMDAGLGWLEIAVCCETTVAIIAVAAARLSGTDDPTRFVTEIIDTITLRAHQRAMAVIIGEPQVGQ